jgi:hypothetical protein
MREITSRSGCTGLGGPSGALALASALAAFGMAGCFGDTSSSSSGFGNAPIYFDAGSSSSGAASGQPLLAVVDTGQTLSAPAGQGVGVFIEYQTGGHWHLSWTCDTELTGRDCPFGIAVALASSGSGPAVDGGAAVGAIANVSDELMSTDAAWSMPASAELAVSSTTSTALDGIGFDTFPGATITLTVTLSGVENGSFFFFVQDGKVNGGYKGTISDPLMLVPSAP